MGALRGAPFSRRATPPAAGQHGLSLAGGMTRCAVPDAAAPGTVSPGLNGQVISMGLGRPGA